MNHIIEVEGLKKSFGSVQAVRGISFYVEAGKLFAFLGPNGAGKSTTVDILCTILRPDAGKVCIDSKVLGQHDSEIRSRIGVVFQDHLLDPLLMVEENMRVRGSFYKKTREELNEAVKWAANAAGVSEILKRPYGKLSGGQKRRADVARALINTPKILFLDEPTTGLDPQTRKNLWDNIRNLQRNTGMTVFLTTHYMEEAAEADYVVVIDNGQISAKGTPNELRTQYASDLLKLYPNDCEAVASKLNEKGIAFEKIADALVIKIDSTMGALPLLEQFKPYIEGFEVQNGTMNDAFLGITGKELRQ